MDRRLTLLTIALAGFGRTVRAQSNPAALRLIVPTPAGGPSDTAARVVATALARGNARTVLVENRPGAGGSIAARAVLDARPDGQTLLWTLASMAGIPVLQKSPPFQSLAEFTPVGSVGRFIFALFVAADHPAHSVAELVTLARARPDALSCAHGTLGEMMAAVQFMKATGTRAQLVPYKGGAQLMPDLATGRVQLNFGPLSSGLAQVQAGKVRALAVLAPRRSPLLPEVPTLAEAGVSTGALPTWQALLAPPGTPAELAQRLSREVAAALQEAELRATLERQALIPEGSTPAELTATISADATLWRSFAAEQQIAPE
jgi:tripartite-type tricarboxylate transporter receptor subunit TctC